MTLSLFDSTPLWIVFILTIAFVFLAVHLGHRAGLHTGRQSENERQAPIDAMVGSTLGLLAFVLAFTFGMATNRFDSRNELLVDDAIAIRTADLRAQLLPDPARTEVRTLISEYVDIRVVGSNRLGRLPQALKRSDEIQAALWSHASRLAEDPRASSAAGPVLQAVIEMGDMHTKRVTAGLENRLPGTIWFALYCITGLAMAISGYRTGLAGRRSVIATFTLVFAYSAVILLIADLDRPLEGFLRIDQKPLVDLQSRLHSR